MARGTRGDNRLTDTGLRRARLTNGKAILQDGGGLIFEVTEAGGRRVARAVYRFRFEGARPDMRLGSWPDKSLSDLRALRDKARALVRQGKDPREAAREEKIEAQRIKTEEAAAKAMAAARLTVRGAFERWDALHLRRSFKDGGEEVRRYFARTCCPPWETCPLRS
jgi:hypothetical protein